MKMAVMFVLVSLLILQSQAYRPGDIVPMSKMGQYHSVSSLYHLLCVKWFHLFVGLIDFVILTDENCLD